ncbi:sialate O-acetylesterase [Pontiellaceae bacterium B12219]|nr:sialate O-acetylesterase [Pontiellaceae bacterium B12219]
MKEWILLAYGLMFAGGTFALELELPSIFADKMVLQRDMPVPVWGTADAGTSITVEFAGQIKTVVADASNHWNVMLDPMEACSEPRVFQVSSLNAQISFSDVLVGEVWFAGGQSNMYRPFRMLMSPAVDPAYEPVAEYLRQEAATADDPLFRQYRAGKIYAPFNEEWKGRGGWSKAVPGEVNEFCGTAYFFGRELRRELDVPVALISCNLGATRIEPWIAPKAFAKNDILKKDYEHEMAVLKKEIETWDEAAEKEKYKEATTVWEKNGKRGRAPAKPEKPEDDKQVYGTLYNGMVSPIIPYAIRGVIWYQGESNTGNFPEQYDIRLEALIDGWRRAWSQNHLYFYWCQLANYKDAKAEPMGDEDGWPVVQDRMRRALHMPDTGMAVLNDIGEAKDIHPKNKVDAGKRLSFWALNQAYGQELVVSGPLYKSAERDGNKVVITFDYAGSGLMTGRKHLMDPTEEVQEPLKRFQICDASGDWKWAEAEITGSDQVTVWHDSITEPVEVRYAWAPNPEGANLYNKEGLPASVFTTGVLMNVD